MSYRMPITQRDYYYMIVGESLELLRAYRNYDYANEWRNNNLNGRGYIVNFIRYNRRSLPGQTYFDFPIVKHIIKYDKSDCFIFTINQEEIKSLINLGYHQNSENGYLKFDSRIKQLHPDKYNPIEWSITDYKKDNLVGMNSVYLFQFSEDEQGIPFYTITEYPTMKSDGEKLTKMMSRELFNFISQE